MNIQESSDYTNRGLGTKKHQTQNRERNTHKQQHTVKIVVVLLLDTCSWSIDINHKA